MVEETLTKLGVACLVIAFMCWLARVVIWAIAN